jgi:thiol-disulfide isomerase/thioredoxin
MGKHLLLPALFFIINQFCIGQNFSVTGDIGNSPDSIVYLSYAPKDYYESPFFLKSKVQDGKFSFKNTVEKITEAQLFIGKKEIPMLIQPNDSLHIELNDVGGKKIIKWSGEGAANNLFFLRYIAHSVQLSKALQQSESFLSGDANTYRNLLDSDKKNRISFLKNYLAEDLSTPNEQTKKWIENSIRYEMARALVEYPKLYQKINPRGKKLKIPKDYYAFISQISFGRKDLLGEAFYQNFIASWMYDYLIPKFKNKNMYVGYKEIYRLAEKKLTPSDKIFIQYRLLKRVLINGPYRKSYGIQVRQFMRGGAPNAAKEEIQQLWNDLRFNHEGTLAPDFEFLTADGKKVKFKDYRGKVLYVDFWATWCSPCLRSFPYSYQLQEEMKKYEDLVFLFISIDKDKNRWLTWLKENKEKKGEHLLAISEGDQNILKYFNINAIPHWMTIDHNGVVVNYNARSPGSDATRSSLRRYLRKTKK